MDRIEILDSQVHIVGEDTPERPWDPNFGVAAGRAGAAARKHFTKGSALTDEVAMLKAMDRAHVDGALLVATSHYGWDNSYSTEAAQRHSDRFRVVGRINHEADDVEKQVSEWAKHPVAAGLRILVLSDAQRDQLVGGAFDRLLGAAQQHDVPVCVCPWGYLPAVVVAADRFPRVSFVVDHLGLTQPPLMTPDPDTFQRLPELLELARRPNVSVKISAAPTLAKQGFPYADLWPHLHAIIGAFGIERLMWGSDWTRVTSIVSLEEGIRYIIDTDELGDAEKVLIMGANLRRVFRWT